jgi:hypothetical protein
MQIVPVSEHVVVQIENDSEVTLIKLKKNEIKEPIRINCSYLEDKLCICCWTMVLIVVIFFIVFFIVWGRFNESSQKYPPPYN